MTDIGSGSCIVEKTIDVVAPIDPAFAHRVVDATCSGSATGRIELTVNQGLTPFTYTLTPALPAGQGVWDAGSSAFINVPAGNYTVRVTGSNDCFAEVPGIIVDDNDPLTVSAPIPAQFGCSSGTNVMNNASLTINIATGITDGSGTYPTVELYNDNGTPTNLADDIAITALTVTGDDYTFTITDPAGGNYYVRVLDSDGCEEVSTSVQIDAFDELQSISVTPNDPISCTNGGELVNVTFVSSAAVTGAEVIISNTTGIIENITGVDSGAVVVNTTRLPVGVYTISVVHPVTGCELETVYEVEDLDDHLITIAQTAPVDCVGSDTAAVSIVFDSGTPYAGAYTYTVYDTTTSAPVVPAITGNGTSGNTPLTIGGLSAGQYYVEVIMTDFPECTRRTADIVIDEPTSALDFTLDINLINCVTSDSGEIQINATGGWGGYEYMLVNNTTSTTVQAYSSNSVIRDLVVGDYTVTVRDANGCENSQNLILSDPAAFVGVASVINPILCQGDETGAVRLDITAGGQGLPTPTYFYTIREDVAGSSESARQSSNVFSDLRAGDYVITVYDEFSCFETFDITVNEPAETQATGAITGIITCTSPNATIEISGTGGTGTYEYLYSNDGGVTLMTSPTNTISVTAGDYSVYVRDTDGCLSDPFLITIDPLEPLMVSLDTSLGFITCTGDGNAVLSATATGGLGNYSYELLDASGSAVAGPQSDNTFGNVGPGTYSIRVTSLDCIETTTSFVVVDPPLLEAVGVATDISCNGDTDGSITVNATGGTGTYVYEIDLQPGRFQTENVFNNLPAGTYSITVQDGNGCFEIIDVTIIEPPLLQASIDPSSIQQQICSDDPGPSFTVDIVGGTAPYTLELSDGTSVTLSPSETSYTFTGLTAGQAYAVRVEDARRCALPNVLRIQFDESADLQFTHELTYECDGTAVITGTVADQYQDQVIYTLTGPENDTNDTGIFNVSTVGIYTLEVEEVKASGAPGCIKVINNIEVEEVLPIQVTIDDTQINTLIVNATGGIPPYEYSIDGSAFTSDNEFIISESREYTITVRDSRGCEEVITFEGVFITIEVPNLFTPNGDGQQDYWYPIDVQNYHELKVFVYDRYGRLLGTFEGIQQGWDGTYQGKPLPSGDYWYTLEFREITGEEMRRMGHFTLYRY
ncbi:T9SS type B sorting domain-containing protein [Tenacibaculum sp. M341]|nr:T9SS type B sorting domain-containing protein [Tenacibaculum sp. M341]